MESDVLTRFAEELLSQSIERDECCDWGALCEYHSGYADGIIALVGKINVELVKVGYRGT